MLNMCKYFKYLDLLLLVIIAAATNIEYLFLWKVDQLEYNLLFSKMINLKSNSFKNSFNVF